MITDDIKQKISSYIDGELSSEETVKLLELFQNNPEYKKYYNELVALSSLLKVSKDETLSPDGEANIQRIINQEGKTMKTSAFEIKRPLATVAVFGLVMMLSWSVYQQTTFYKQRVKGVEVVNLSVSPTPVEQATPVVSGKPESQISMKHQTGLSEFRKKSEAVKESFNGVVGSLAQISQDAAGETHRAFVSHGGRLKSSADGINGQIVLEKDRALLASQPSPQYEPYYQQSNYTVRRQVVGGYPIESSIIAYPLPDYYGTPNSEEYGQIVENRFLSAQDNPLSTFSIDVDTASYSNVRRFLTANQLPPTDSVRIEEMINYFDYDYPLPEGDKPFSITTKASVCPWNRNHQLVMVGLQGKTLQSETVPPSNLVFLIDVSGSMASADKLPLLKQGLTMMANQLSAKEKVAIVVYAGAAGQVLPSTSGDQKQTIINAINNLQSGGSTAGAQGIELAYQIAKQNFIEGGNNRVILATDGDFNVGITNNTELVKLIEEKRKQNIFLTVLGFGQGNIKDNRMEQLANKGDGNYYYIDTIKEANKVLISELGSTLFTIAKDVKIQIEFNPAAVKSYRLIGYENRMLNKEDFNDDTKDAGELGAGHSVTALYEIVPVGADEQSPMVDPLKYQKTQPVDSNDLMTVKLRYKKPAGIVSELITQSVGKSEVANQPTGDFAFAASVAEFGMLLRNSENKGNASYQHVISSAQTNLGKDEFGYRNEFISLVQTAMGLDNRVYSSGPIQFK